MKKTVCVSFLVDIEYEHPDILEHVFNLLRAQPASSNANGSSLAKDGKSYSYSCKRKRGGVHIALQSYHRPDAPVT